MHLLACGGELDSPAARAALCFSRCFCQALTRAGKYDRSLLSKALTLFEQMISHSNHLSLYSEEIARSGESLGNFPQVRPARHCG